MNHTWMRGTHGRSRRGGSRRSCSRRSGGLGSRRSGRCGRRRGWRGSSSALATILRRRRLEGSLSKRNLSDSSTSNRLGVNVGLGLVRHLEILHNLVGSLRVDDHHLAQLTVRSSGAIDEHGFCRQDGHVEGTDSLLTVFERDVSTVNGSRKRVLQRRARGSFRRLCHGVVTVCELELNDIADGCRYQVRDHGDLLATNDDRDDLSCRVGGKLAL